jgi:hypothetical protein
MKSQSSKQKEITSQTILPSKEAILSEIREELPSDKDQLNEGGKQK